MRRPMLIWTGEGMEHLYNLGHLEAAARFSSKQKLVMKGRRGQTCSKPPKQSNPF